MPSSKVPQPFFRYKFKLETKHNSPFLPAPLACNRLLLRVQHLLPPPATAHALHSRAHKTMSLPVKIPLLVVAILGAWYALTPPQPPPDAQERVKSGGVERSFGSVVRIHAFVWKVRPTPPKPRCPTHLHLQCSVIVSLLAELACVLLDTYPHHYHQLPLRIMKHLPPPPPPESALPAMFMLGCLVTAASGALRWACYKTLGSLFTFELTLREDHRLVTSGPYGFVRHPSYSGVVLGVLGTLLVHFGPGSWWARAGWLATPGGLLYALCWCAVEAYVLWSILCRAPTEDAFLRKQFGAEWDAWAARVPYKVIPGVF
jgi:protein-S-isoprenylcysteine O-methyltransferase Ste14